MSILGPPSSLARHYRLRECAPCPSSAYPNHSQGIVQCQALPSQRVPQCPISVSSAHSQGIAKCQALPSQRVPPCPPSAFPANSQGIAQCQTLPSERVPVSYLSFPCSCTRYGAANPPRGSRRFRTSHAVLMKPIPDLFQHILGHP